MTKLQNIIEASIPSDIKTVFGKYPFTGNLDPMNKKRLSSNAKVCIKIILEKNPNFRFRDIFKRQREYQTITSKPAQQLLKIFFGSLRNAEKADYVLIEKQNYSYYDFIKDIINSIVTDWQSNMRFDPDVMIKQFGLNPEPNTKFEDKLIDAFFGWYIDAMDSSDNTLRDFLPVLKSARKKWPNVFKPHVSDGTVIFRGMLTVSDKVLNTLKKKIELNPEDFTKVKTGESANYYMYKNPIKYTTLKSAQSWTDSIKIAKKFTSKDKKKATSLGQGFILITKCNDEFFMNKNFSKLFGFNENEIIHIGKYYKSNVYIAVPESLFEEVPKQSGGSIKSFSDTILGK